jgi:hypothetical protein
MDASVLRYGTSLNADGREQQTSTPWADSDFEISVLKYAR